MQVDARWLYRLVLEILDSQLTGGDGLADVYVREHLAPLPLGYADGVVVRTAVLNEQQLFNAAELLAKAR